MQTEYLGVVFTGHALARLRERGIAQSDAWYTWRHPTHQSKGSSPGAYRYSRKYGRQEIEVIAKKNDRGQWLILSVWSNVKGNGQPLRKSRPDSLLIKAVKQLFGL